MITDPWFYAAAIPAMLLVGLSKGGFAGGLGILGVPMMALVVSPLQAAGIMLPILIAMDMIGVWAYRKTFDKKNLMILLPGAAIGILIAFLAASYVTDSFVRLLIGGIALAFTLDHWIGRRAEAEAKPRNRLKGSFWGGVGGFTSFVAHAGGPPFQIYMLPQKLDKVVYVGTSVMFFTAVNLIKVPPYIALGQFQTENLMTSLVLLPLAPIGMLLGIKALHVIPEKPFYRIAYAALFLVGLKLIWDGAAPLLG
ncbi:sulfite exporter TauE/SafE family protein [Tepidicaulis sp. LMO-SS28]|uniref:sulfite exporter TauE/SafE family protein n=1 Tax=Tepidicaulis sp. LMO-SS28 TaxID=3447455 RepID=UPI003EDEC13C